MNTKSGEVDAMTGKLNETLSRHASGDCGTAWIRTKLKDPELWQRSRQVCDDGVVHRRGAAVAARIPNCNGFQPFEYGQRRIIGVPLV